MDRPDGAETRDGSVVPAAPGAVDMSDAAPPGGAAAAPWPAVARWAIAGAALASAAALAVWSFALWQHLKPSAFDGQRIYRTPLSFEFGMFVARPAVHAAVVAGAAAALARWRGARGLLLLAAAGVFAVAAAHTVRYTVFPPASFGRKGPDYIVSVAIDGAHQIAQAAPHLLLVLVLARVRPARGPLPAVERHAAAGHDAAGGADRPRELGYYVGAGAADGGGAALTWLVVLVASVVSAALVARYVGLMWIQFRPASFQTIGVDWGPLVVAREGLIALLHGGVVAGAGALLVRRGRLGRGVLLAVAVALILMHVGRFVYYRVYPPAEGPRYSGVRLVYATTADVARQTTSLIVYAILALAMVRAHGGAPEREGN